jgi:hypothetical protein
LLFTFLCGSNQIFGCVSSGFGGKTIGIGEVRIVVAGDAIVSTSYYLMNRIWNYNSDFYSKKLLWTVSGK